MMVACEGRAMGVICGDAASATRASISEGVRIHSCWAASGSISDAETSGILEVPSAGEACVSVVMSTVVGVLEPRPSWSSAVVVEEEAEAFIFGSGKGGLLWFGEGSVPEVEGKPEEGFWVGEREGKRADLRT